ncbi:hypothetical protein LXA43DRAFT_906043 [Ganoderma leucocontextum]|nr:hypothetical protein LXA43DRAFT_906043 [Ganoderma leucocontextum]
MFAVLQSTDAVIGGSAVLDFVLSSEREVENFNIFAPFRTAAVVVEHLQSSQCYEVINSFSAFRAPRELMDYCVDDPCEYLAGVREVTKLQRGGVSVDVIASGTGGDADTATLPLACQWTTLLMSYIGADGLCVAYPKHTFAKQGAYSVPRICHPSLGVGTNPAPLNKYLERGFHMFVHGCLHDDDKYEDVACDRSICGNAERRFGDNGCCVVPFSDGGKLAGLGTRWRFGGVPCRVAGEVVFSRSVAHAAVCEANF